MTKLLRYSWVQLFKIHEVWDMCAPVQMLQSSWQVFVTLIVLQRESSRRVKNIKKIQVGIPFQKTLMLAEGSKKQ